MNKSIRILHLLDADKCTIYKELQKARSRITIADLEREYSEWWY